MVVMKRIFIILFLLILSGCGEKISNIDQTSETVQLSIYASENQTKTSITGTQVLWNANDDLSFFVNGIHNNIQFKNINFGSFAGQLPSKKIVSSEVEYYCCYPYLIKKSGTVLQSSVPEYQAAPFDGRADVMVADIVKDRYDETDMPELKFSFKNHLLSIIHIPIYNSNQTMSGETISEVKLETASGLLTGVYSFDISDGESAEAVFDESGGNTIVLRRPASQDIRLKKNHIIDLYAVARPGQLNDLKITIETSRHIGSLSVEKELTFVNNAINNLPIIDIAALPDLKKKPSQYKCAFMGDSITQFWQSKHSSFFTTNNFLNKGISAQVTSQMLDRFQKDIIENNPEVVLILAGINDISVNKKQMTDEETRNKVINGIYSNIKAMSELAESAGIKVILCSILPTGGGYKELNQYVPEANVLIKGYADSKSIPYVNFYPLMLDKDGYMDLAYAADGCHPTVAGYEIMENLCLPLIMSMVSE